MSVMSNEDDFEGESGLVAVPANAIAVSEDEWASALNYLRAALSPGT